jgi:hypothetical protein
MGAKGGGDDGIGDAAMYRAQRASADRYIQCKLMR